MRGLVHGGGGSPFWEAWAGVFARISKCGLPVDGKEIIADLMPTHHDLYSLPAKDAGAIGQCRANAAGGEVLEEEGFKPSGMVDIFDAGPI